MPVEGMVIAVLRGCPLMPGKECLVALKPNSFRVSVICLSQSLSELDLLVLQPLAFMSW